jgi:hypothetical protein
MSDYYYFRGISFDDFTSEKVGESETTWSQICSKCADKYVGISDCLSDCAGKPICGVHCCGDIADYYIDFKPLTVVENNEEENKMDDKLKVFVDSMVEVNSDGTFVVFDRKYTLMNKDEALEFLIKLLDCPRTQLDMARGKTDFVKKFLKAGYTPEDLDAYKGLAYDNPLNKVMVKMISFRGIADAMINGDVELWTLTDYITDETYLSKKGDCFILSEYR